jgi:carbamoyltransferase
VYIVSTYLGHNASMTVSIDSKILEVVEFERMTNVKNGGCLAQVGVKSPQLIITLVKDYLMQKYNIKRFDLLLFNHLDIEFLRKHHFTSEKQILNFFNADRLELVHHQHGHMAGAFYQSDLQYSRGVSFDGGGSDGNFNVFECHRKEGIKQVDYIPNHTIGMRLSELAQYTSSIRKEADFWVAGGLVYPGKIMGLSSYGTVREEWLEAFKEFYTGTYEGGPGGVGLDANYLKLKATLNLPDVLEGELEKDLVATSQRMFELKFEELIGKHYKDQDTFIVAGGCALNILNNQRLRNERNIFVPPNPNDAGLSLGFMLDYLKPEQAYDGTFAGPEVWDKHSLAEYVEKYDGKLLNLDNLVQDLMDGKIIGVVRGGSELGPRALGHRSIICHAAVPGMKDILNKKVKNREPFRPFAPVCREGDAYRFFHMQGPCKWMSFCPEVKEEHKEALASITHVDGTARLQTVTYNDMNFMSILLGRLNEYHAYPVLLNTSFNIAGKPILNTYRDAIWMLENTEMDGVIFEDYYIKK